MPFEEPKLFYAFAPNASFSEDDFGLLLTELRKRPELLTPFLRHTGLDRA